MWIVVATFCGTHRVFLRAGWSSGVGSLVFLFRVNWDAGGKPRIFTSGLGLGCGFLCVFKTGSGLGFGNLMFLRAGWRSGVESLVSCSRGMGLVCGRRVFTSVLGQGCGKYRFFFCEWDRPRVSKTSFFFLSDGALMGCCSHVAHGVVCVAK